MPLTVAHSGFVLFLKKRYNNYISLPGLVIGSIVPDLDILFRFSNSTQHIFDYSLYCVFLQLLPLSLLIGFILHYPYTPKSFFSITHLSWFILSAFIAIMTHIFLDFISHINAWAAAYATCLFLQSKKLFELFYYFYWYAPQIALTSVGLWLTGQFIVDNGYSLSDIAKKYLVQVTLLCSMIFPIKFFLLHYTIEFSLSNMITDLTATLIVSLFILYYLSRPTSPSHET